MQKTLYSTEHARLLEVLSKARRDAGLTQQALAARLKRPQSFVAKIENGERRIDVVEFVAIAHALGVEPAVLFERFTRQQDSHS